MLIAGLPLDRREYRLREFIEDGCIGNLFRRGLAISFEAESAQMVRIHQHGVSVNEKLVDRKKTAEERFHFPAHFPLDGAKILRI